MFIAQKSGTITVKLSLVASIVHLYFHIYYFRITHNEKKSLAFKLVCLLNYHKHRFRLHRNGLCETCNVLKTVPHFLFRSKKYLPLQIISYKHIETIRSKYDFKTVSDKSVHKFLLSFLRVLAANCYNVFLYCMFMYCIFSEY